MAHIFGGQQICLAAGCNTQHLGDRPACYRKALSRPAQRPRCCRCSSSLRATRCCRLPGWRCAWLRLGAGRPVHVHIHPAPLLQLPHPRLLAAGSGVLARAADPLLQAHVTHHSHAVAQHAHLRGRRRMLPVGGGGLNAMRVLPGWWHLWRWWQRKPVLPHHRAAGACPVRQVGRSGEDAPAS